MLSTQSKIKTQWQVRCMFTCFTQVFSHHIVFVNFVFFIEVVKAKVSQTSELKHLSHLTGSLYFAITLLGTSFPIRNLLTPGQIICIHVFSASTWNHEVVTLGSQTGRETCFFKQIGIFQLKYQNLMPDYQSSCLTRVDNDTSPYRYFVLLLLFLLDF